MFLYWLVFALVFGNPSPKSRRLRSSKPVPSTSATAKRLFE